MAAISAHKMPGPRGRRAYVRRRNPRVAARRSPRAAWASAACGRGRLTCRASPASARPLSRASRRCRLRASGCALRDRLERSCTRDSTRFINGSRPTGPHNPTSASLYVEGESLLMGINDGGLVGLGTSASLEPSMGGARRGRRSGALVDPAWPRPLVDRKRKRLRPALTNVVTRLGEMSPLYELAKEGVDLRRCNGTEGH